MFFAAGKVSVNSPRFTSNPPQIHHKKPHLKTQFFAKPPQKHPLTTPKKITQSPKTE
jgi:hypothetical protein